MKRKLPKTQLHLWRLKVSYLLDQVYAHESDLCNFNQQREMARRERCIKSVWLYSQKVSHSLCHRWFKFSPFLAPSTFCLNSSQVICPVMHDVGLWHFQLCNRSLAIVLNLLPAQLQLDKDTWTWIMNKVIKLEAWSILCQSQFVFSPDLVSLPPSGRGLMFHCSLLESRFQGVSGSILLRISMRLSSPHR